ncbi:unnamed protein product [Parascedosporium putredinis]|uniref:Uncharacterized protein n=1 Tax=Parascedosporium putredinis TaxID=1442378 RepID=A0A9P1H244_9PEZI|nr:unnamed protein product [Parascedosporium putredinis]CAI7994591.1 unnamed protein product [Parascedosporium putredinis]
MLSRGFLGASALATAVLAQNINLQGADSLTLLDNAIQLGSQFDGTDAIGASDEQVPSLTSVNNFINFCAGKELTNGLQITTGSCNGIPHGDIPAKDKMISSIIINPKNGDVIQSGQTFNIQPVLMPVAQRGAQDDCSKFVVVGDDFDVNDAANNGSGGLDAADQAQEAVDLGPGAIDPDADQDDDQGADDGDDNQQGTDADSLRQQAEAFAQESQGQGQGNNNQQQGQNNDNQQQGQGNSQQGNDANSLRQQAEAFAQRQGQGNGNQQQGQSQGQQGQQGQGNQQQGQNQGQGNNNQQQSQGNNSQQQGQQQGQDDNNNNQQQGQDNNSQQQSQAQQGQSNGNQQQGQGNNNQQQGQSNGNQQQQGQGQQGTSAEALREQAERFAQQSQGIEFPVGFSPSSVKGDVNLRAIVITSGSQILVNI